MIKYGHQFFTTPHTERFPLNLGDLQPNAYFYKRNKTEVELCDYQG